MCYLVRGTVTVLYKEVDQTCSVEVYHSLYDSGINVLQLYTAETQVYLPCIKSLLSVPDRSWDWTSDGINFCRISCRLNRSMLHADFSPILFSDAVNVLTHNNKFRLPIVIIIQHIVDLPSFLSFDN
jgi:hypothetical protein